MIYMFVPLGAEPGENFEFIDNRLKEVGPVYVSEAPGAWFVSYDGTTNELAEKLQLGDEPKMGEGIIIGVRNYQGYASTSLWEWIRTYGGK